MDFWGWQVTWVPIPLESVVLVSGNLMGYRHSWTVVGNVLPDKFQVLRIPRGKY